MAASVKAAVKALGPICDVCHRPWVAVAIEGPEGNSLFYQGCATPDCSAQFIKVVVDPKANTTK